MVTGRWRTTTLLAVAHVSSLWAGVNGATAPVRALAVLGVESGTLWVFIAGVGTVIEAANVMIFSVVCEMAVCPHLDPATSALAWQLIVSSRC
jgi:hypothetical protein